MIDLPGARTALIVGEVTGHGILAAITTGLLRTAIHTLAALDLQPDELLARLSDTTVRLATAYAARPPEDPRHGQPLTVGCTIAVYDPVELTVTIALAGLPEPVAILPNGTSAGLSVSRGPLLAETGDAPFPATTATLPEGSILALGTAALADEVLASSGPLRPLLNSLGRRPRRDVLADIAEAFPAPGCFHRAGRRSLANSTSGAWTKRRRTRSSSPSASSLAMPSATALLPYDSA
ncbi:PP2C family protein-serine/threonine phosphatase [Streptomyces sp. NPDC058412]|uniref:PP2C family protein-serine/threonine phosphatase n=1 Tax=Streptomyces sp. NPDC058412 TaxID=3346486 RepID=UPI00364D833C